MTAPEDEFVAMGFTAKDSTDEFVAMGFTAKDSTDEFSAIGVRTVSSGAVWFAAQLRCNLPWQRLLDLLTRSDHEAN